MASDLAPLQVQNNLEFEEDLRPVQEYDSTSYDLVAPPGAEKESFSLEQRSQTLFSKEHLQVIFANPALLLKFTAFLSARRPQSVPLLIYYLDALKAVRAIHYANAICEGLEPVDGLGFTNDPVKSTSNPILEQKARDAFEVLAREDLPAYITHVYINIVSLQIGRRITGWSCTLQSCPKC